MSADLERVGVVFVAYGPQPLLRRAVEACLESTGVALEIVIVDNGVPDDEALAGLESERVRVIGEGINLGFAAGCNFGAAHLHSDYIAFINTDAIVEPEALVQLSRSLHDPEVGIASASLRLAGDPDRMNAAGLDVHPLGLGWCRGFADLASEHPVISEVAAASGAAMALRRDVFTDLGGFDETYFAYYEDIELSHRARLMGFRVIFVPAAIVHHAYAFDTHASKFYLLESNRLITVLSVYRARTLALLAIPLLAQEVALLASSIGGGWSNAKRRSLGSVFRRRAQIREKRRGLQSGRVVDDREFVAMFATRVQPENRPLSHLERLAQSPFIWYWSFARRLV